jgi:hypothetical protein
VTRKTQFIVSTAAALLGLAVVAVLWLHHGHDTASDKPASPPETAQSEAAGAAPNNEPVDPQVMSQVREAYQKSLAEGAPPGMIELMQGPGNSQPGDLPPLPADPLVIPAGHHESSGSSADLPPLPPNPTGKPKPLPQLDATPTGEKTPKEAPSPDLPPLPPLPK